MKIYTIPSSFDASLTAGGQQSGFEVTNIENSAINIPFLSTNRAGTGIQMDLGSQVPVHKIFWHNVNFTEANLSIDLGRTLGDFDTVNTGILGQTDNYGRSWIHYAPFENGYTSNYRYVWLTIPASQSTLDGSDFYVVGSGFVMTSGELLGYNPEWNAEVRHVAPVFEAELPNGARPQASSGPEYDILRMSWGAVRERNQYPEFSIRRGLRAGPIIVDLEYYPWYVWPMVANDVDTRTTLISPEYDRIEFDLKELVTI